MLAAVRHVALAVVEIPNKGYGLVAARCFNPGEMVFEFTGSILTKEEASTNALQVADRLFLESSPEAAYENYLNHSCDPNCDILFEEGPLRVYLVANRTISAGEELAFDYDTTEYDLIEQGCAFECHCGAVRCRRTIKGFRHLLNSQRASLVERASPYIRATHGNSPGH